MRSYRLVLICCIVLCACGSADVARTPAALHIPTLTALPVFTSTPTVTHPLALPYGALVDDAQPGIALVGLDGETMLNFDAPSDAAFQPGSAHLAGNFSGQGFPPLVYVGAFKGSNAVVVNRFNGLQVYQASDFLLRMVGAPAQPILAVSESLWLKGNDVQNNIFFGTLDEMRVNPSANVILVDNNGMAYTPVGISIENGQALGFFFTRTPKGAQNPDLLIPLQRSLVYFDAPSSTLVQVLGDERFFCGLSPSMALHASTNLSHLDLRVHDTGHSSYRSLALEASSDLGAGYVVFSPDDQSLAWMEASSAGTDESSATLVKIASRSGSILHTLPDSFFETLISAEVIKVTPAGFLDTETLLVQFATEDGQGWLASVDVPSGNLAVFHAGTFLAFTYP